MKFYIILLYLLSLFDIINKTVDNDHIIGQASYYHDKFDGRIAADGSVFNQNKLTAASNKFELGDSVIVWRVKNKDTFKVKVKITDRMSKKYGKLRYLDLSKKAMKELKGLREGIITVYIQKL